MDKVYLVVPVPELGGFFDGSFASIDEMLASFSETDPLFNFLDLDDFFRAFPMAMVFDLDLVMSDPSATL
jgi:hypothetical protein